MNYSRFTKKAAVGVLTAAMVFGTTAGMGVTAWADETATTTTSSYTINTDKKGNITFHKYDSTKISENAGTGKEDTTTEKGNPIANVTFGYVKVAGIVTYTSASGSVENLYQIPKSDEALLKALGLWDTEKKEVKSAVKVAAGDNIDGTVLADADAVAALTDYYFTSNTLNGQIIDADGKLTDTYKKELEAYIIAAVKGATADDKATKGTVTTNSQGTVKTPDLDLGLYLCAETAVPLSVNTTQNPFFVSVPMTDSVGQASDTWNYDIHVYPKNQVDKPTLNKLVKENDTEGFKTSVTASEGDTVTYQLQSKLPKITTEATYLSQYTFVDTLAAGLSYVADTSAAQTVTITFNDNAEPTTWTTAKDLDATAPGVDAPFKVTYVNNTMEIEFTEKGLAVLNEKMSEKTMTITYTATVNSDNTVVLGDNGNKNTVTLDYRRTNAKVQIPDITDKGTTYEFEQPTDTKLPTKVTITPDGADGKEYTLVDTNNDGIPDSYKDGDNIVALPDTVKQTIERNWPVLKDEAMVYSYSIDLTKVLEGETGTPTFANVVFTLKNKTDGSDVKVKAATAGTAGAYYVSSAEDAVSEFTVGTDGHLHIYGLEADEYTLTEVKTESGYSLLKNPITIVISAALTEGDTDTKHTGAGYNTRTAAATVDTNAVTMLGNDGKANGDANSHNAIVPLTVINTKSFTLPQTGGAGVLAIVMVGALTFSGAVIFLKKKARE